MCKKLKNRKNRFKPTEIEPKFRFNFGSVRFRFYYVKNQKVRFSFWWQILIQRTDRIEIYYYIIFYIKYIILGKYWLAALCWTVDLSINHHFILIQLSDSLSHFPLSHVQASDSLTPQSLPLTPNLPLLPPSHIAQIKRWPNTQDPQTPVHPDLSPPLPHHRSTS